jgi:hypothetical protein
MGSISYDPPNQTMQTTVFRDEIGASDKRFVQTVTLYGRTGWWLGSCI